MTKKPFLVDVPVLLVFFTKEKPLKKVFERIREARPSKLYLCQDGPRKDNTDDKIKIDNCRKIVSDIDWECEVKYFYQKENLGCDPNIEKALNWVFENEEYMIMLEDDGVVDVTFFAFCKELFEKYKYDSRIALISSFNLLETWDCPYDYFFSNSGTLSGGWGMWKRAWIERNAKLDYLSDEYTDRIYKYACANRFEEKMDRKIIEVQHKKLKDTGKIHSFEIIVGTSRKLNHALTIVPTRNMMSNIGIDAEAYHSGSNIKHLPSKLQHIFFMKTYSQNFPLSEPPFIIPDKRYCQKIYKIIGDNNWTIFFRRIEGFVRRKILR